MFSPATGGIGGGRGWVSGDMRRQEVILKSAREIERIRLAGRVVHAVLERARQMVRPGVTTKSLNDEAEVLIAESGATPLFKGVKNPQAKFPFPAVLCTSVNEELVHGVPGDRVLKEGDIVGVDCGVRLDGYCADSAVTIPVGSVSPDVERLLEVTQGALRLAVESMLPGKFWSVVARRIQRHVEQAGFSVVREFVGHGIGRAMHEEPKVPNYWDDRQKQSDFELTPGLVIAVEPMVNLGGHEVTFASEDRWAVITRDRKFAAHFEHTVAVTERGPEVLTDDR